jgi:hypothetical protein
MIRLVKIHLGKVWHYLDHLYDVDDILIITRWARLMKSRSKFSNLENREL